MRRRLPYFTPASILFALLLILGLGFATYKAGGIGINPGPVSAKSQPDQASGGFSSHADFEQDCTRCHQPLGTAQAQLCQDCHLNVKEETATQQGLHGSLEPGSRCADCHPEHRGRDFDPTAFALAGLDHNQTHLPLTGKHIQAACQDCHIVEQYRLAPVECSGCHSEPRVHQGVFNTDCASCHTTAGWKPATVRGAPFDHAATTFQLTRHAKNYAGEAMTCADCHTGQVHPLDPQAGCASCHAQHDAAFMAKHQVQYGANCTACHDGTDRMVPFDHARFFVLSGKHAGLECQKCHSDPRFAGEAAAPSRAAGQNPPFFTLAGRTACVECHQEPEMHAGAFGLNCDLCHIADAWSPALLRKHTFPLDHGRRGEQSCQTCHAGAYTQYTCTTCHAPDGIAASHSKANVSAADLPNCAKCHPGGKR